MKNSVTHDYKTAHKRDLVVKNPKIVAVGITRGRLNLLYLHIFVIVSQNTMDESTEVLT